MHYRPVFTQKPSDFDFDRMVKALDDGRRLNEADEERVFKSLPLTVSRSHPVITIERSKRYTDSIVLVTRERKKKFLIPFTEVHTVDLRICGIADLADELECFERGTVAGEAFEEESTVHGWHGRLRVRCRCGEYELAWWPYGSSESERERDFITMNLFAFRELIGILRSFGTCSAGWKERHLSRH